MEAAVMARPEVTTTDQDRPAPIRDVPFFVESICGKRLLRFWYKHPVHRGRKAKYTAGEADTPLAETVVEFVRMFRDLEAEVAAALKERDELHQKLAEREGVIMTLNAKLRGYGEKKG